MFVTRCLMVLAICATVFYSTQKAEAFSVWCEGAYAADKASCNYRFDYLSNTWIGCRQQALQDVHSCYSSAGTWTSGVWGSIFGSSGYSN